MKTCFLHLKNEGADKIRHFKHSVVFQTHCSKTWSETPKTDFLTTWLNEQPVPWEGRPPGGGGRLHVSCVPMREQKTTRKGIFFELGSAQRCHHLG